MAWNRIAQNWNQFRGKAKERWGTLTDADLDTVGGERQALVARLQEAYGIPREEAEVEVLEFEREIGSARA